MRAAFLFLAAALLAQNADAQDIGSANYMVPACQRFLAPSKSDLAEVFDEGICVGVIRSLMRASGYLTPHLRSCLPSGVTSGQMVRVVLAYIERRPQRMHEDFVFLAIEAAHEAWPCK
jgi:hypothetical protein